MPENWWMKGKNHEHKRNIPQEEWIALVALKQIPKEKQKQPGTLCDYI